MFCIKIVGNHGYDQICVYEKTIDKLTKISFVVAEIPITY